MALRSLAVPDTVPDSAVRAFEERLPGAVVRPDDLECDQARRVWNAAVDRYPALVVRPRNAADVSQALNYARANDLPLAVRSGGHSVAGHGTVDGVVI